MGRGMIDCAGWAMRWMTRWSVWPGKGWGNGMGE